MVNNSKKWKLEKRYSEIEEMHKKIVRKINDIPFLPAKSIFQIMGDDLEKRKNDLEKYLNVLASRRDVLNDLDFKSFLEIEKHYKTENLTVLKQICEISNFPRGVKDFIYLPQKGLILVLLAETNTVSKLGTIISNLSSTKGKEELSSVVLYKEDPPSSFEFKKIWKKSFTLEASMICLDPTTPYLAVGFSNGSVTCLKLEKDDYSKHQEFCNLFCHNQPIRGMTILPENGYLISCSPDKYIIKADVIQSEGKLAERAHSNPLTCLLADHQSKRFFVGDSMGSLFIYSTTDRMELLSSIISSKENLTRALFFDPLRNMLLSGSNKGIITIYEIGRPGKEKLSNITGTFETIRNIKSIHFSPDKKEIYVANSEGHVALVNTLTTEAFHIHSAHSGECYKMIYLENKKLMITAGGDKSLRFWRYPYDPKEKLIQKTIDQSGEVLSSSNPAQQYLIQSKQGRKDDDDDEDDLRGSTEPITLLKYQPATKVESEDEDEEDTRAKNLKKNTKESPKKIEEQKSNKVEAKTIKKPLFIDDEDEDEEEETIQRRKNERQASPKSFLFKNSIDPVIKKTTTESQKKNEVVSSKKEQVSTSAKKNVNQGNFDPLAMGGEEKDKSKEKPRKKTQDSSTKPKPVQETKQISKPSVEVEKKEKKVEEDDDKPLNFEELKKTSNYVPLTFKKAEHESDDEELQGWNS